MSGIYIRDMTLEEFSDYGDYCQTLIGTGQAEEVPAHGRLIDADAIDTAMYDPDVEDALENAPTIIPAEHADKEDTP